MHGSEHENGFCDVKPVKVAWVSERDGCKYEHEDENWQFSMSVGSPLAKIVHSSLT